MGSTEEEALLCAIVIFTNDVRCAFLASVAKKDEEGFIIIQ